MQRGRPLAATGALRESVDAAVHLCSCAVQWTWLLRRQAFRGGVYLYRARSGAVGVTECSVGIEFELAPRTAAPPGSFTPESSD